MDLNTLIDNVKDGNNVEAGKTFNSIMAQKLSAAIDAKKIEVASTMASNKSPQDKED